MPNIRAVIALGLVSTVAAADDLPAPRPTARIDWTLVVTGPDLAQQFYTPALDHVTPVAAPVPWTCKLGAVRPGKGKQTADESVKLECSVGEAATSVLVMCSYSQKQTHAATSERRWKPTDVASFYLGPKGTTDPTSFRLSCMVDTRYTLD
jgi:hypothetical protein